MGCHSVFDPVAFNFEIYGGLGEYRIFDQDDDAPIDPATVSSFGSLQDIYEYEGIDLIGMRSDVWSDFPDGPMADALALIDRLATSRVAHDCYTLQWYRFAFLRRERLVDEPEIFALQDGFAASGGNIRELLRAIVSSDAFRSRP